MVHSGYEASGVNYTFGSIKGLLQTAKAIFFSGYKDDGAQRILNEWKPASHGPLVQIAAGSQNAGTAQSNATPERSRSAGSLRRLAMATEIQEHAKLEQLSHLNPDEIEVAAGREARAA